LLEYSQISLNDQSIQSKKCLTKKKSPRQMITPVKYNYKEDIAFDALMKERPSSCNTDIRQSHLRNLSFQDENFQKI
jgi:hypothetical protein